MTDNTTVEKDAISLVERMKGGCCRCPHDSKSAAEECCEIVIEIIDKQLESSTTDEFLDLKRYWENLKQKIESL